MLPYALNLFSTFSRLINGSSRSVVIVDDFKPSHPFIIAIPSWLSVEYKRLLYLVCLDRLYVFSYYQLAFIILLLSLFFSALLSGFYLFLLRFLFF